MSHFRIILIAVIAGFILLSAVTSAAPQSRTCTPLPDEKVALQMYSMNGALGRGAIPTPTIESVLAGLHKIGYKNTELAGTFNQPIATVRPLLEKNQIKVIGNHGPLANDMTVWAQTIADAQALGQ